MANRLQNKTAIVTGASSGIGLATAELFLAEGANVAFVSRPSEHFDTEFARIANSHALKLEYDISVETNWDAIVSETVKMFGKIDILVNCAGIFPDGSGVYLDTMDRQLWDEIYNINVFGTAFGMKHVIPEMSKLGAGSIVNISSMAAVNPHGRTAFSLSKSAVIALSKQQALSLIESGIRVNIVIPDLVNTKMSAKYTANPAATQSKKKLAPFCEPIDVANAILFLAGDESSYITGIELPVDGGYLLN